MKEIQKLDGENLERLAKLTNETKEVNYDREEGDLHFEINAIDSLLQDSSKSRQSGLFFVKGLRWYFKVNANKDEEGNNFLFVTLHAFYTLDKSSWQIQATSQVKLVHQSGGNHVQTEANSVTYHTNYLSDRIKLISVDDLVKEEGFIKNDSIKIIVSLKAEKLYRM